VCCSVLQCAAVCGSVWQCVAVCGSVWQCVAVCCSVLQSVAHTNILCPVEQLYCVAAYCSVCCSVLQCVAFVLQLCCSGFVTSTDPGVYIYIYIYVHIDKKRCGYIGIFDSDQKMQQS